MDACPLCLEQLGDYIATLKCGHRYCSECILNAVAKNTGTVEGNTRNQCPMCRAKICDKIEPDAFIMEKITNFGTALDDYDVKVHELNEMLRVTHFSLHQRRVLIFRQRKYINMLRRAIMFNAVHPATIIQKKWRGRVFRKHSAKHSILT
tara:strand:+ start:5500 stop:5949 length:450 start_codon:yes stop_codon:yes gene_type:complete